MSKYRHTYSFTCDQNLDKKLKQFHIQLQGLGYKIEDDERKVVLLDGEPCEGC